MKLNLGCGDVRFAHGWTNIDLKPPTQSEQVLANETWDLREKLPVPDNLVQVIFCSHFLEHLDPQTEAVPFLQECRRVLAPGKPIRIIVPDLAKICDIYTKDPKEFYAEYGYEKPWFSDDQSWNWRLGLSIMFDHKMLYDSISLAETVRKAGFNSIRECTPYQTFFLSSSLLKEIKHTHIEHSLILEAV